MAKCYETGEIRLAERGLLSFCLSICNSNDLIATIKSTTTAIISPAYITIRFTPERLIGNLENNALYQS